MVRWAWWYPLSSTDPNNIGQIEKKLPAMYNCILCVCICVIVGFVLLVSVIFKTSGRCLLKGGKYVAQMTTSLHFQAG